MSGLGRRNLRQWRGEWTMLAFVTLLLAVLTLAACGDDDGDNAESTAPAPRTVGREHLEELERGSPERAVLEWWRQVQFGNPAGAEQYYAADVDVSSEEISRQISYAASSFVGVPEIVDVDRGGGVATVYMTVRPPGSDASPRPISANMREEDGSWVLRDNQLMEQQAARVARARAAAEDG